MPTLTSTSASTMQEQQQKKSLEAAVFKLKLQWMMAKSEDEKRKLSEEIRQRIGSTVGKQ